MNTRNIWVAAVVLTGLMSVNNISHAVNINNMPLPPYSNIAWVAADVRQNGIPMKIQTFSTDQSVDDVLEFYRAEWSQLGDKIRPGFVENSVGGWSVISALEEGSSLVVQIRPGQYKATEGFISSVDAEIRVQSVPEMQDVPAPDEAIIISDTGSDQLEMSGITRIMSSTKSVSDLYLFYSEIMPRNGWRLSTSSDHLDTAVLMYAKRNSYCEISISPTRDGNTVLLINRVSGEAKR